MIFLISLIVLVPVGAVLGVEPTLYMLQIPIALILVFLLSYGCGMILATIGVFFRDMEYLWSVAADADHVYLCDLLLSVQTAEKRFFMDPEI